MRAFKAVEGVTDQIGLSRFARKCAVFQHHVFTLAVVNGDLKQNIQNVQNGTKQ